MKPAKRAISAHEQQMLEKGVNAFNQPVVACGRCGAPTSTTGTKRCDACWELERLIHDNPGVAYEIMQSGGFL